MMDSFAKLVVFFVMVYLGFGLVDHHHAVQAEQAIKRVECTSIMNKALSEGRHDWSCR